MKLAQFARLVAATAWVVVVTTDSPASAAEITWKAGIWGPPRLSTQPLEWYAEAVAAKTGRQMKIQFLYDEKGKGSQAADWVKAGKYDASYICTTYYGDRMPLATVIDLPMFAPDSPAVLGRVELALADHPAIQAELRKWNLKMLVPAPLPHYQLMGTRRVVRIADLQGAKIRISVETGKILEEYGATIHPMPADEVLAALKSGTIDTVASSYPLTFLAFRVHEASKYVTEKISLGTQLCYLGVSQKAWDALPAHVQTVMLSLRQPAVARYEESYAREDATTIATFRQKGIEFVSFNPADRARLVAKAIKYWQAWVEEREKQGLKGREVFEFTQAKIREFTR
jgi:TRAP-type C4-dicarboxylate transport system substrate-binding protein